MHPVVSIVIVNWKTPRLLAGCLQSIYQDESHPELEIWVVDNASGDGSVELLQSKFPAVKLIANQDNVGFARACNQVIPQCSGDYILLLNPDTVVMPGALRAMVDYLNNNVDCGVVGPKILNPDGTLQLACRRSFPSPEASLYRLTYLSYIFPNHPKFARYNLTYAHPDQDLDVDALSGSCMMVRKDVIKQVGLLDEDIFMYGEDIDWCWRIKENGWRISYHPAAVVFHYHGASSRFRRIGATINLHKGMEVFYRKHMAAHRSAWFNSLVYAGIWFRAALFCCLSFMQNLLPQKKEGVFAAVALQEDFFAEARSQHLYQEKEFVRTK